MKTKKEILDKISYEGIEYIEFILENCETIRIPRKYIGYFMIDDIKNSFTRTALNAIGETIIAKNVLISIHKDANKNPCESFMFGAPLEDNNYPTFERLSYNDITSICIHYLWGEEKSYYVDYDEANSGLIDTINKNQYSVEKYGDLYIHICEKGKEEIEFPDDEDERNFMWEMWSIPFQSHKDKEAENEEK